MSTYEKWNDSSLSATIAFHSILTMHLSFAIELCNCYRAFFSFLFCPFSLAATAAEEVELPRVVSLTETVQRCHPTRATHNDHDQKEGKK